MLSHAIEVLGWTLLHFVWQGAVVGVLTAAMLLVLRRRSANARYLAAVSALSLMLLLPLGTIAWIEQTPPVGEVAPIFNTVSTIEIPRTRDDGTLALDEPPIKVERIGIDFENPPPPDAVPMIPASDTGKTILEDLAEQRSAFGVESFLKPFIPWAVAVWLIGVGVLSLRLFASWLSVLRLRRRATQPASADWQAMLGRLAERLRVTRPVKLVESALVEVPAVIGWLRPVILLPASAMTGLTTEQLEALLAHELAHVRRHDYLINLLQTVVETLLFYHPAVWWVSHRIRVEREHCCDDLAASVCGDRLSYAQALVAMEELRAPKIGLVMSSSGGSLLTRVARLIDETEQQRRPTGLFTVLLSLVSLTMAGALGAGLLTPPEKPTEGLPNNTQPTTTESTGTNEETSGPTQRRSQETRAEREPEISDAEWGHELNGLRTRLTLLSEEPLIGRLVVKVEVENVGTTERTWRWYPREVARYFRIIGPDGKDVEDLTEIARIHSGRPIVVRPTQIKPGETKVLLEFYDLAGRFLLARPGQYEIRFGKAADGELAGKFKNDGDEIVPIPESSGRKFQLGEGELPEIQSLALRLRKVLPVGFGVGLPDPDEIHSSHTDSADSALLFDPPDHGKKGMFAILGFFGEGKAPPKLNEKDLMPADLGPTKLGNAFLIATRQVKTAWPNCLEQIRDQLPQEDKADAGKPATTAPLKTDVRTQKPVEGLGRFVGRVRFKTEKALPDLEKVELPAGKVLDESLVFSKEGGLANVFVYLRKPTFKIEEPADAAAPKPFVLIAEGGKFWPHAALVRVGRPAVFENREKEAVNFRPQPLRNNSNNFLPLIGGRVKVPAFTKSESVPFVVKSDIQPWMQSHLLMLDHPFADVTDEEGRFTVKGLPPGQHEFRVWHERVGYLEKSLVVTIKPGEESRTDLEYKPDQLKLDEAAVQSWGNRQIDATRNPRPRAIREAPPPKADDKAKPDSSALGGGLPTSPPQPNDAQKTETSGSIPAAGAGDPRRAQAMTEVQRALLAVLRQRAENDINIRYAEEGAEVARAELAKMLEANRKVPGSIPATEIERAKLLYQKAVLQIEHAEFQHRIHQLELEFALGQNKDDGLELTHKTLELRWLRAKVAADRAKAEQDRISDANRRVPGTISEAEVTKARLADETARSQLERAQIEFQIDAELAKLSEVAFTDTPLADVAAFLSDYHNIPVELDATAKKFEVSPVTLTVTGADLVEVLSLALHPMTLSYCIDGGRLLIATPAEVQRRGHKVPRSFADELAVLLKAESTIAWESLLRGNFGENNFVVVAPKLSKLLDSDDVTVQRYAARGLVQFDFVPAQARPRLEKLTRSKDTRVARGAWLALVSIGRKDFSTLPLMLAELDRADKSFGLLWPVLLAHFDESVWDELTKAFPTSSPQVRAALAASVRYQTDRSLPVALLALEDAEHRVRRTALNSIRYETPPAKLVSAMQARLKDEALDIRVQAAGRLLSYGKAVNEAVELLLSELEQADQGRASVALHYFTQVHSPEAIRAVVDALDVPTRSKDTSRRRAAWRALMFLNLTTGRSHPTEVPWGPTRAGLRTRLSVLASKSDRPPYAAAVGEPIKLKLELKNFGDQPVEYDAQQAEVNQPLIVVDDDMRPVKRIAPQLSITGTNKTIKPGETHVLVEQLDLTAQYDLKQPGNYYIIRWTQDGPAAAPDDPLPVFVPNSNVLTLLIQKAEGNGDKPAEKEGDLRSDAAAGSGDPRRAPAAKLNSVRERLQNRISLSLENVPLNQVVEHIGREATIAVRLDSVALENDAIPEDNPVSISVDGISTASALYLLLQPIQLGYVIENETLVVTTVARLAKTPVDERLDLGKALADEAKMSLLKDAIQTFVEPKSWDVAGGAGSIRFHADRKEFVVRHVPLIQYEVNRFLTHVLPRPPSPELQRLRKLLAQRFTLELGEVTLRDAVRKIAAAADANVVLDANGLDTAGIRSDRRVTLNYKDTPLRDILDGLCKPLKLRFRIQNDVIQITDEETAQSYFFVVLYPVSAPADDLANRLQKSIRPESWKSAGGQGTIETHRPTNSLIIRQQEDVHDEIEQFFAKLGPGVGVATPPEWPPTGTGRGAFAPAVKPAAQLKGQIRWIEKTQGMVWINLGHVDGVARPMRFQVREKADPKNGDQPPAVKGTIEVSRVIDGHMSEARIILDDQNNAVAKGDEIVQLFETTQPNDKPNEEQRKLPPPKGEIYDAASPGTDRITPKKGSVSGAISGKRRDRDSEMLDQFTGRVRLKTEKPLPDLEKVVVPAGKVLDESLVFSKDGGLANVFVYLQMPTFPFEPPPSNRPPKPFIMIAEGGKFWPHAAFVRVGRPIVFENRQTDLVNFFMDPQRNVSFNVVAKAQDQVKLQALRTSEKFPFAVKSTIQPWMRTHLLTLDHPFAAVTDEEGRFTIDGLPPGDHGFHVWHERVGYLEKTLSVTIKAGEPTRIVLEYEPSHFNLDESDVLNWGQNQIDAAGNPIPKPKVAPRAPAAAPKNEAKLEAPDAGAGRGTPNVSAGRGSPDPAPNPTAGLPEGNGVDPKSEIANLISQISKSKPDASTPAANPAIERAVAFLKSQQKADGSWDGFESAPGAVTSLCVAALLQAGVKPDDAGIQKAIAPLRKIEPSQIYAVALQTMVFCAASPKEDAELIRRNVAWIEKAQVPDGKSRGAWSYGLVHGGRGDGSCSRFALLGLHAAKKAGFDVQAETWRRVSDYYLTTQTNEGGWSYSAQGQASPTMTLAGVAGLATANRYLPQDDQTKLREAAIRKPAEYLEKVIPEWQRNSFPLYAIHCVERAGHVSGLTQFGKLDWKSETTKRLLDLQSPKGSWNSNSAGEDELVATSLALLSLTGQPEPKLLGRRFKFEPRGADKPFHVRSSVNQSVVPPKQLTELSGGVRIVFVESDGTTWRIEADRALIESDDLQGVNFAINASNHITRIEYIGSVKVEGGKEDQLSRIAADRMELDLSQNDSIVSQFNSGSPKPVVPIHKPAEDRGRFVGRVWLKTEKPLPDLEKVKVPQGKVLDESLVFSKEGGLANVFVYLWKPNFKIEPPPSDDDPKPFVLISEGWKFSPHAAVVRVGRPIVWENQQPTNVNFRTAPLRNDPHNVVVPPQERFKLRPFTKAETFPIEVRSDIYPWMQARLFPVDHPFATVTDNEGRFAIDGLPPGKHEFRIWQERVGYLKKSYFVTIKPGEETQVELKYEPKALKLEEAEILNWNQRFIESPKMLKPLPRVPQRAAEAKPKDAEAEAANRRIRNELQKVTEVAFIDTPLSDVLIYLSDYHNIPVKFDASLQEQLKELRVVPITITITGDDLEATLLRILHNQRLSYFVDTGELRIAAPDEVRRLGHPVPESFAETLVKLEKAGSSVPWKTFLLGHERPENETRESWLKHVETLTKLLSHSDVVVQRHAASVLARFDEAAVHARPALEKLTKSEDRSVRQAAWQTLLAIGRQDLSTWPLFLAAWNNKDEYVREHWLMTLLQFHPRVFDELVVLFPTSSVEFRRACSASLRHRRERPSYEQLAILAMSDEDEETRYLSLRHARTEDPSQPFLSPWRRRLKDESPRCRVLAASNLLPLESDRLDALEVLLDEIGSADESRWPAAAQVITAYATVDYGGQFRDRLLRRSVTGDEQQRAVIRKALKFVPESRSHAAILQEIDAQLENVREDKRFPLAKRLEFLDELGRDRMTPNGSKELRARVGHHLAHYFAKWDLIAHNARVREYSLAALKLDVDADRRASLFSLVGSAALVDPAVPTFAEQRSNAAKLWLTGYREVVSLKLPKSAPELPVVEKLGDIAGEPPEQRAAREQQHATQLEARQQAEFIRRMVAHRHQLAHLLVETHRRDPANEPELRTLAKGVLVDKSLVEMLLAEGIVPQQ